jgi:hypothetical protein
VKAAERTVIIRSLTLREECRLSVFENRVLRRIFGSKRNEVTGEWRRLHKKELYALCFMVIKSRKGQTEIQWGSLRVEDHLEDPRVNK